MVVCDLRANSELDGRFGILRCGSGVAGEASDEVDGGGSNEGRSDGERMVERVKWVLEAVRVGKCWVEVVEWVWRV
ncbi:hypothetical protein E2C01_078322 [Portunus trituberculatus]|uniref:Uncharacterized protein n=1 Tax=Portunus trituberculatus TaxID=210409 RepID=A0A5B7INI4_PORTR|nr:hypothetical protein [Portunus trituberculatus]